MNIDLQHYIDQARKSGMADEQIRQGLLQSGWSMNDINEALMNLPAAVSPQPRQKAMMSKSLAIIFIFITVAVVGYFAGAYYMANYQNFPLWPFEGAVPTPTPIGHTPKECTLEVRGCPDGSGVSRTGPNCEFEKCPGEADTSTWKTYTNTEYGFEFKYPGDGVSIFSYSDSNAQVSMGDSESVKFNAEIMINKSADSYITNLSADSKYSTNNIMFQGKNATELTGCGCASGYWKSIIIPQGSNLIVITLDTDEDLFNQILSTFRFTR